MVHGDRVKFPYIIIFKEQSGFYLIEFGKFKIPENTIVRAFTSGYINEEIIKEYIYLSIEKQDQLFIIDSAACHKGKSVATAFRERILKRY